MDTVAGRQLYQMGKVDALKNAILEVLKARFKVVPNQMTKQIRAIEQLKVLKTLLGEAIKCQDIEDFQEKLQSTKKA